MLVKKVHKYFPARIFAGLRAIYSQMVKLQGLLKNPNIKATIKNTTLIKIKIEFILKPLKTFLFLELIL